MKFITIVALTLVLLSGGLMFLITVRMENDRLRYAIAELHSNPERTERAALVYAPPERATTTGLAQRASNLSREIDMARREVAALEQHANQQFARLTAAPPNDDPEKGMTRLEDLKNVGRTSPAKAFQTLAWAGLHGDADAMVAAIGIAPDARPEMEALVASLPPEERMKYPTPETLIALFLSKGFVNLSGIQIVDTKFADQDFAELTVRGLVYTDQNLPMRLGPDGWQLWEGKSQIAWLRKQLANQQ